MERPYLQFENIEPTAAENSYKLIGQIKEQPYSIVQLVIKNQVQLNQQIEHPMPLQIEVEHNLTVEQKQSQKHTNSNLFIIASALIILLILFIYKRKKNSKSKNEQDAQLVLTNGDGAHRSQNEIVLKNKKVQLVQNMIDSQQNSSTDKYTQVL